ncbi:hypothetical protein BESB_053350 [Besnoitia besnoiti]|uniref:Uncharacterized protein n=1 Tax=Besnoitia besnoiti TaxID=94643 RepID=A0A2A9MEP4_BESBE|nr:hypothetical protein BESB_053350 [Besnoitia besnoiti]PFH35684.1 hypothetical protein BESB_053350 [Besnoitia besnoiti]
MRPGSAASDARDGLRESAGPRISSLRSRMACRGRASQETGSAAAPLTSGFPPSALASRSPGGECCSSCLPVLVPPRAWGATHVEGEVEDDLQASCRTQPLASSASPERQSRRPLHAEKADAALPSFQAPGHADCRGTDGFAADAPASALPVPIAPRALSTRTDARADSSASPSRDGHDPARVSVSAAPLRCASPRRQETADAPARSLSSPCSGASTSPSSQIQAGASLLASLRVAGDAPSGKAAFDFLGAASALSQVRECFLRDSSVAASASERRSPPRTRTGEPCGDARAYLSRETATAAVSTRAAAGRGLDSTADGLRNRDSECKINVVSAHAAVAPTGNGQMRTAAAGDASPPLSASEGVGSNTLSSSACEETGRDRPQAAVAAELGLGESEREVHVNSASEEASAELEREGGRVLEGLQHILTNLTEPPQGTCGMTAAERCLGGRALLPRPLGAPHEDRNSQQSEPGGGNGAQPPNALKLLAACAMESNATKAELQGPRSHADAGPRPRSAAPRVGMDIGEREAIQADAEVLGCEEVPQEGSKTHAESTSAPATASRLLPAVGPRLQSETPERGQRRETDEREEAGERAYRERASLVAKMISELGANEGAATQDGDARPECVGRAASLEEVKGSVDEEVKAQTRPGVRRGANIAQQTFDREEEGGEPAGQRDVMDARREEVSRAGHGLSVSGEASLPAGAAKPSMDEPAATLASEREAQLCHRVGDEALKGGEASREESEQPSGLREREDGNARPAHFSQKVPQVPVREERLSGNGAARASGTSLEPRPATLHSDSPRDADLLLERRRHSKEVFAAPSGLPSRETLHPAPPAPEASSPPGQPSIQCSSLGSSGGPGDDGVPGGAAFGASGPRDSRVGFQAAAPSHAPTWRQARWQDADCFPPLASPPPPSASPTPCRSFLAGAPCPTARLPSSSRARNKRVWTCAPPDFFVDGQLEMANEISAPARPTESHPEREVREEVPGGAPSASAAVSGDHATLVSAGSVETSFQPAPASLAPSPASSLPPEVSAPACASDASSSSESLLASRDAPAGLACGSPCRDSIGTCVSPAFSEAGVSASVAVPETGAPFLSVASCAESFAGPSQPATSSAPSSSPLLSPAIRGSIPGSSSPARVLGESPGDMPRVPASLQPCLPSQTAVERSYSLPASAAYPKANARAAGLAAPSAAASPAEALEKAEDRENNESAVCLALASAAQKELSVRNDSKSPGVEACEKLKLRVSIVDGALASAREGLRLPPSPQASAASLSQASLPPPVLYESSLCSDGVVASWAPAAVASVPTATKEFHDKGSAGPHPGLGSLSTQRKEPAFCMREHMTQNGEEMQEFVSTKDAHAFPAVCSFPLSKCASGTPDAPASTPDKPGAGVHREASPVSEAPQSLPPRPRTSGVRAACPASAYSSPTHPSPCESPWPSVSLPPSSPATAGARRTDPVSGQGLQVRFEAPENAAREATKRRKTLWASDPSGASASDGQCSELPCAFGQVCSPPSAKASRSRAAQAANISESKGAEPQGAGTFSPQDRRDLEILERVGRVRVGDRIEVCWSITAGGGEKVHGEGKTKRSETRGKRHRSEAGGSKQRESYAGSGARAGLPEKENSGSFHCGSASSLASSRLSSSAVSDGSGEASDGEGAPSSASEEKFVWWPARVAWFPGARRVGHEDGGRRVMLLQYEAFEGFPAESALVVFIGPNQLLHLGAPPPEEAHPADVHRVRGGDGQVGVRTQRRESPAAGDGKPDCREGGRQKREREEPEPAGAPASFLETDAPTLIFKRPGEPPPEDCDVEIDDGASFSIAEILQEQARLDQEQGTTDTPSALHVLHSQFDALPLLTQMCMAAGYRHFADQFLTWLGEVVRARGDGCTLSKDDIDRFASTLRRDSNSTGLSSSFSH